MSAKKLPKGCPPVPKGMIYRGYGNGGKWKPFDGATCEDGGEWFEDRLLIGMFRNTHYAMLAPKPAKKPAQKKATARKVKTIAQLGDDACVKTVGVNDGGALASYFRAGFYQGYRAAQRRIGIAAKGAKK